jgi:S1-C subfamily serine protease
LRLQEMAERVIPTTVAIRVGQAHGSGVIISPDGYVLTAAHVAIEPDLEATVRLHDGTEVRALTLGVFRTVDAGLIRITTPPGSATPVSRFWANGVSQPAIPADFRMVANRFCEAAGSSRRNATQSGQIAS